MRVWVDLTNSPHVLVFRPLIAAAAGARARGRGHRARVRPDACSCSSCTGSTRRWSGTTAARSTLGKARAELVARARASTLGEAARLRPRARPRLARPDADRPLARHPERDDVRLRVRLAPAPARLPRGDACGRPRGDPARAAGPVRRKTAEAAPLSRPEGGVLPGRLRAGRGSRSPTASELVVVRTPPEVSLYHRHGNPLFRDVLERLGRDDAPPRRRAAADGRSSATRSAPSACPRWSSPTAPSMRRA